MANSRLTSKLAAAALAVAIMATLSVPPVAAFSRYWGFPQPFTYYPSGVLECKAPVVEVITFMLKDPSQTDRFVKLRAEVAAAVAKKQPGVITTFHFFKVQPSNVSPPPGLTIGHAGAVLSYDSAAASDKFDELIVKEPKFVEGNAMLAGLTVASTIKRD